MDEASLPRGGGLRARRRLGLTVALALLGGCTPTYVDSVGPDEYTVRGTSLAGMYGGLVGLSPSPQAVMDRAAQFCPNGYDKISERNSWELAEGSYLEWRIRCHEAPSKPAG